MSRRNPRRFRSSLSLAILLSTLTFAACGGSGDDDEATNAGTTITAGSSGAAGAGAAGSAGASGTNGGGAGATGGQSGKGGAGAGGGGASGQGGTAGTGTGGSAGVGAAGSSGTAGAGGASGASGTAGASGTGGATAGASGASGSSGKAGAGGTSGCTPPDVLITLDRTLTMHFTPDGKNPTDAPAYASSKWAQAITAIEKVTAKTDQTMRFGLELWPKNPGTGCVTLAERINDTKQATNPSCQEGEIAVPLGLGQGPAIATALDPLTTKICTSTPTGEALITASTYLTANAQAGRPQYVALVTDGADWDQSCPKPDPLAEVQKLATAGIKTFVVGFYAQASAPGGVGIAFLNDMACSGQTATGFPASCKQVAGGWVAADPKAAPLFLTAEDSAQLEAVLGASLGAVGCKQ